MNHKYVGFLTTLTGSGPGSSVSVVTRLRAAEPYNRGSCLGKTIFHLPQNVLNRYGTSYTPCKMAKYFRSLEAKRPGNNIHFFMTRFRMDGALPPLPHTHMNYQRYLPNLT